VGQSTAGKSVSTEIEDILEAVTTQPVNTQPTEKTYVCAIVNCNE
jgi:hypothetical protein